ncbi:MAG TPA: HAD-IB family phosphatase [Candidatus Nanoarchaeia archaeon]|nr:HAD-IB family phosphatase [Candidatus Nanoarchaeia archaeon]
MEKIRTVIFDMDGTIAFRNTHEASYAAFFRHMGLLEEEQKINDKYADKVHNIMTPENHQRQFAETIAFLEGKVAPTSCEVFPSIPYAPGFTQFCRYLRSHEVDTGIVTLSLLYAANRIREENDMQFAYANEIHVDETGRFTGKGTIHVLFGSKGEVVRKAYQAIGGDRETTAYIGDSLNDVGPWNSVALPLGVNLHKPELHLPEYEKHVDAHFEDFYGVLEFFKKNVELERRL